MTHLGVDTPLQGHRRNPSTNEWETEVTPGSNEWRPASEAQVLLLNLESPPSGGGSSAVDAFIASRRPSQGNGAATQDEAFKLAIEGIAQGPAPAGGMKLEDIVIFPSNNRWFFGRKDEVPPVAESWSIFKENGQVFRINSKNGEIRAVQGIPTGTYETFDIAGTDEVAVRLPDGNWIHINKSDPDAVPGQLTTQVLPLTDKVLVTLPDGTTKVVDKAQAEDVQAGINAGSVQFHEESGHFVVTQPNGSISLVKPIQADPTIQRPEEVTIGGQPFAFNPNTGSFQQVQRAEFDPGVVTEGGRAFIQGPGGELTPLGREEIPDIEDLINSRIVAGDAAGALALSDFRDRPTSTEAFAAAMQFAQSPGDVAAISAISRGQSLVAPPPSGTVQRIAEQPEFLQDAYQRLINQFRGGTGSPGEFMDVLTRINKEFADSQAELEVASEENRQLEFQAAVDKAVAPFKDRIATLTAGTSSAQPSIGVSQFSEFQKLEAEFTNRGFTDFSAVVDGFAKAGLTGAEMDAALTNTLKSRVEAPPAPSTIEEVIDGGGLTGGPSTGGPGSGLDTSFDPAPVESDLTSFADIEEAGFEQGDIPDDLLDFFAEGGIAQGRNLEIVGEKGPELVDLAPGSVVTPIKKLTDRQVQKLREMGIRGLGHGGVVEGLEHDLIKDGGGITGDPVITNTSNTLTGPLLPFGVRRALAGAAIEPTRRRLSRAAGLPTLSLQARQNLLPEELEVFQRLSREAGIPEGAARQEQESAFPGANLFRGRARFAPRALR